MPEAENEKIIEYFALKKIAAYFWFVLSTITFCAILTQVIYTSDLFQISDRFIMVDQEGKYYFGKLRFAEDGGEIMDFCGRQAVQAFLEREPDTMCNKKLLKQLFILDAVRKFMQIYKLEENYFSKRKVRQRVNLNSFRVRLDGYSKIRCRAHGYVKREGNFYNQSFSEELEFVLILKMVRNPYWKRSGRLPYAVYDFIYRQRMPVTEERS